MSKLVIVGITQYMNILCIIKFIFGFDCMSQHQGTLTYIIKIPHAFINSSLHSINRHKKLCIEVQDQKIMLKATFNQNLCIHYYSQYNEEIAHYNSHYIKNCVMVNITSKTSFYISCIIVPSISKVFKSQLNQRKTLCFSSYSINKCALQLRFHQKLPDLQYISHHI